MREPEGSVLLLIFFSAILAAGAAPLASKKDEQLPHSRDYYDGYVRALVDHYNEIFRSQRDVSAQNQEVGDKKENVAEDVSQMAAKKDDVQAKSENANSEAQVHATANNSANPQNNTTMDRPYMNPEQTGKPPVSDTEKEEAPTPDAHKKNENDKSATPEAIAAKESQQNMFKSSEATNLPETMQDIKFYTGKVKEFEDMKKKRSAENDAVTLVDAKVQQTSAVKAATLASVPAASTATATPLSGAPVSVHDSQGDSSKRDDMQSESKLVSHSSSTYTPGDPYKTPPQQKPTPPDPYKEEPYKKDSKEESDDDSKDGSEQNEADDKKIDKDENKDDAREALKNEATKKEENSAESEKTQNEGENETEADKEFDGKTEDEEDDDQEFAPLPTQPLMVLVPVSLENGYGNMFASGGARKDKVGKKREDKKKDDKKEKDDDDDEDEHEQHAYLAPLCGYPGWYEAGHGLPYGYGANMLCGHHEHGGHGYGHHGYIQHGFDHHDFGHHGFGHHGFGHHGYGHHGLGHHGFGHHGSGHHGMLRLDNGVVWPYGGYGGVNFFHSPCGCNSGLSNGMGLELPFGFI